MSQKYEVIILPLISVTASFLVGAILILLAGENPLEVYWVFAKYSLFSINGLSYTLFYTTPLIFTGLAVAFGFRCGLFNIGAEGQLYIGAFAITLFAIYFGWLPSIVLIPACLVIGFVAGGIWGGIPGLLKAQFGGHEVINTIMMNFVAFGLVNYLVSKPFHREGAQVLETEWISENAKIPKVHDFFSFIPEFVPLNASFLLALLACVVVYVLLWKTKWGYEIRAVGSSNSVSEYAGISVKRNMIFAMFFSGGLAGLVGIHEVLGYRYTYHDNFSNGLGFIGIAVALLGRNHPVGIIFAAFLFGALERGSLFLDLEFDHLSEELVVVLQGIFIFFVATDNLFKPLLRSKK